MRLFVDRRLATSARSGPQFTDQVTPVLVGAEHGRQEIENHFEGYISELRVWNRALSSDEAAQVWLGLGLRLARATRQRRSG